MRCTDKTQHYISQRPETPHTRDTTIFRQKGDKTDKRTERAKTISDEMSLGGCETPHLTGAK